MWSRDNLPFRSTWVQACLLISLFVLLSFFFWPLRCLFFFYVRLLITSLVSFGHCVVCSSSMCGFWLPLWYLLAIVLSVLLLLCTASDYLFGIFWPLCYLFFFFYVRLLITSLVSFGHCVVCSSSSMYGFWLPLWYLLAIVLSVLLLCTASDYFFGIFWPLCCLFFFFYVRLLITSLVSFGHCVVCSSSSMCGFWLPLWYLLAIVMSVLLLLCTASDYLFGIFWPFCCLFFFFYVRLLITSLVSFGHCAICSSSSMYSFWLPLWYRLAIVLSVLLLLRTASDYLFGIFWPLSCLFFFFYVRLLITSLVSFGHCVVCSSSSMYSFWLPLWYRLAIVLSVLLLLICTASDYLFGIFWPLRCLFFFFYVRFWLPLWYLLAIVLSVLLLLCTASDYLFDIFWPLWCLFFFFYVRLLITSLVSFGYCVVCSSSSMYGFWLPLWYLLAIVLSVLLLLCTASDYLFGIVWPLCCLFFFFYVRLLITFLVSFGHWVVCSSSSMYGFWLPLWYLLAIVLSVLLLLCTASDYLFGIVWPLCCLFFFFLYVRLLITSLESFGHCVVCSSSSMYGFWLPLWYLLAIVLSVLLLLCTASDYLFDIFWPLWCLFFFFYVRLLITSLVSFGYCVVCSSSSMYGFWLPLWNLLAIVLSVLLLCTASDYLFGIFWPLCCLFFFFYVRLLITSLVSFGHCVVCSSSMYGFWLPLWYHLAIVLSVLLLLRTASDYLFGIFWPLSCLFFFFYVRLLITSLVSFGHCDVCSSSSMYGFWLPLWYLLVIVLSVLLLLCTASDYLFGIFWPLCCLFFFYVRLLITSLVSFGHCVVCSSSSMYGFWLPLWYLLAIVLSVLLLCTASDYLFGIFWLLCCLFFFFYVRLLITSLESFDHCVVCSSSMYGFWLPLWYLLAIVLSVLLLLCTASDYLFGIFWPLCCLFFFYVRLLITSLVSFGHCVVCSSSSMYGFWLPLWYLLAIVMSVLLLLCTASDYLFGIFWLLCCLFFFFYVRLLITSLESFGHCVVCSSSMYGFWLPLWYLLAIVLSVLLLLCTASDYLFGIFWPLCCLFFFYVRLLITSLVSFGYCVVCSSSSMYGFWLPLWNLLAIVLSVLLLCTASDYLFGIFWPLCCLFFFFYVRLLITSLVSFGHCVVCSSSMYGFWLPLWYILAIVLSVFLLLCTASDYLFGIFWLLCCLFFFYVRLLITSLESFGHCVVCSSSMYGFWLPLWNLLAIVLSVLLLCTASDYLFGIFWPLCCLFFFYVRLLITSLESFGYCVVCSSSMCGFWLPLWYLLAIALSVLLLCAASDYLFGIFWPLCCLFFFFYVRLLITSLVCFGRCVVCFSSSMYGFWLPLWYLLVIVLSVLLLLCTASDYFFGIFWPLCCLFFFYVRLLITSLESFGHCVVCSSSMYGFWLPLWNLLAIVLSVLLLCTASDYFFGIFWPLCCLFFFYVRLLITSLVSFGHCVVCSSSSMYGFWLPLWYLLAIVLSVLLLLCTASDYLFGIFWPLCCLFFFFYVRLLITSLVSFGHCAICSSSMYGFWLPLWYLLAIVLSVLLLLCAASDYLFGIFWPLWCLFFFFYVRLLITSLVSFGHCALCSSSSMYGFWLLLWNLLAIVLSVPLLCTASDYLFGIFWPLCCLFFFYVRLLITSLESFGHCVVCSSSMYGFWLPLWNLLAIVLSVLLLCTASDYLFGIFWPLCCLFFFSVRLLITSLESFGYCVVCSSSMCGFWLPLWYLLAIALSVLLLCAASDYLFGIFWPLCCLFFFFYVRLLITSLVSFGHCVVCFSSSMYGFWLPLWYLLVIVLSVLLLLCTASDYFFGIFWPLCCLFFFYVRLLITSLESFGHCVVCSSSMYGFWLPLWYLLAIVLSVLLLCTASDYFFGIFWPLCCLFFFYVRLLITSLVCFGRCVVCFSSSMYGFWLPLWYLLVIVLSVLLLLCTASDYFFGIFWPLCCLFFFYVRLLITSLESFGHCVVCSSSMYGFWLLLWNLLAIVLSVLLLCAASDYLFGIFWPLCCLFFFFYVRLLITSLVSFGHCAICSSSSMYGFWLPLWYLLAIVLSVLFLCTASDYFFGIFWLLCCLFFFYVRLLITSLVSFGHCVVCSSSMCGFWLPLWYLLAIVLSVLLLLCTASDYLFGMFWPLCCLFFFFYVRLLITSLVSFGYCVVCSSSSMYGFWLLLWNLLAIVLSVLLLCTASDYLFGIFWPLCCLFFFYVRLLITSLVSFGHCVVCSSSMYGFWLLLWNLLAIVLSVLLLCAASDYLFGIFWPLCCLFFFFYVRLLITSLVSFGHCAICSSSSMYGFWLPLWYLLAIVLSVLLLLCTASDYLFGIFWPLCYLFFFYVRLLITSLVSFGHCVVCSSSSMYGFWLPLWYLLAIVLSVLLLLCAASDYLFGIFWPLWCLFFFFYVRLLITSLVSFGHFAVCSSSSMYGFWLPLWYLLAIVLSVLLLLCTASDYFFGIFWPLCCLFLFYVRLLITSLESFGHCVVCSSSMYGFWLLLWNLLAIVLSVPLLCTASDYLFGIFWPLCCLFFFYVRLLITSLVSFGHCVVCSSSLYGFWLLLWNLLAIVLSVLLLCAASDYLFGIFWPLRYLFFFYVRLLITSLVSFGHCVVCSSSSMYGFWLPLWYVLAIVLSVFLLLCTASDYLFGIFWLLCCLFFFFYVRLLITSLESFGHCVVCSSSMYGFWLPLWNLLAIVLSVLLLCTASDYLFGIFWPLCCLFFFYVRLLITSLVSFGHCVVCSSSSMYGFWIPLWYLLAIVLSVLLLLCTASDYLFGIFWPLCCLFFFFYVRLLITSLVSFGHCAICSSSMYGFWLLLWYLLAIVLSVLLLLCTASDYLFGIFWPLCCLFFFFYVQLLITSLVSFGHCDVCSSSSMYGFWLPLWYLLAILLSVLLLLCTASDYLFGIFWPLCSLFFFFYVRLLITSLVSFGHCVVCSSSSTYGFWLPLWYLLAIELSVLLLLCTASDYLFGIFWPLCCLFFFYVRLLITSLVFFGHCVVCSSSSRFSFHLLSTSW